MTHKQDYNIDKVQIPYHTTESVSQQRSPKELSRSIPVIEKAYMISGCQPDK